MADKTYKNFFDDGYTTYHDDGTKSKTYKNFFDDGTTTYHEDGSKSKTYKNFFDDGTTTYHDDGSKSKTYKNFFDDGYTTYHDDGSKSKTYKNFFDDGYTTTNYNSYGSPVDSYSYNSNLGDNTYSYTDSFNMPYVPTGYYYSGSLSRGKPYNANENSFPGWALFLEWLVFGLLMIPNVWRIFHAPQLTQQVWFTITCCLIAGWSGIQMTKRPGFCELFVCFILSFCMCMMNLFGGTWTLLLLIVPTGLILYIYINNDKLQINYFGKLYNVFIFVGVAMIVNAGFYLFKWRMGCQIMMLVWLVAALVFMIINIIRKIYDFFKTGQFKSFSKMKSWIMFVLGIAIPFLMKAIAPSSRLLTVGLIGLGLYFVTGLILTGKNDNRKLLTYTLSFFLITVTLFNLISLQIESLEKVSYAFRMLDRQIGVSLTGPAADFIIRTIVRISEAFEIVIAAVSEVVIGFLYRIMDLKYLRVLDYLAYPNYILNGAYCIGPVLLFTVLGTAIGKSIRKKLSK